MNVNEHIPYRIARLVHGLICRKNRDEGRTSIFGWQLRGRDLSKITDLLAIPIGFLAIKALQGKIEDEEVAPVLPETTAKDYEIKPFQIGEVCLAGLPCGPAGKGPKPTGAGTGLGFGIKYEDIGVPIFPKTAATADEVFPSDGISDITKLKDFEYNIPKSFDPWWLK